MHPAKSVIFFTTASGAGYGLLTMFALFDLAGIMPLSDSFTFWVFGIAVSLIVAGLLSSTFHLGHPERAWRALTQWRSSWLSREGVMAVLTFVPIAAYFYGRWLVPEALTTWMPIAAGITALFCVITIFCTAMIYASLKPIPAWSNIFTPLGYLMLGLASGAVLLNAITTLTVFYLPILGLVAAVLLAAASVIKITYWTAIKTAEPVSTAESATGLGHLGKVSLFEAPHDGDNYLLQEMGFKIARKHAGRLKRLSMTWGFLFPIIALVLAGIATGLPQDALIVISVAMTSIGLYVERWLFFAEAKHSVTLYYGSEAV